MAAVAQPVRLLDVPRFVTGGWGRSKPALPPSQQLPACEQCPAWPSSWATTSTARPEVRLVHVDRETAPAPITDLNVSSQPAWGLRPPPTAGDNAHVTGHRHPEEHRLRLRPRAASPPRSSACDWAGISSSVRRDHGARIDIERLPGTGSPVGGRHPHDHAFVAPAASTAPPSSPWTATARTWSPAWPVWWCSRPPARSSGAFPGTVHHPGRDHRANPGDGGHRPWRYARRGPGLRSAFTRRSGGPARDLRQHAQPRAAADPVRDGRGGAGTRSRRSPRSGCRCRTSTTSWSTCHRSAWTTRTGLPRRRPALRPDRGNRQPGRRRAGPGRLVGHRPVSADVSGGLTRCPTPPRKLLTCSRRSAPASSLARTTGPSERVTTQPRPASTRTLAAATIRASVIAVAAAAPPRRLPPRTR